MMYSPTQADRNFRRRVSDFLAIEQDQAPERPLRLGLIALGVCLMLVYEASILVAVVAAVYFLADLTYIGHARRVAKAQHVSRPMLTKLLTHHSITVIAFVSLAVINAFWPTQTAAWSAVILMFGQALNCIGNDTRSVDATRIGVAVVAVGSQLTAFGLGLVGDFSDSDRIFLHIAVAMITIYFSRVALATASARARLAARTEELLHAQKGEAVGRLTSGIAHDFNNLLTVMRGNIDLLGELPEAERAPLLREIGDATERGGRLVGQLLATSRRKSHDPELIAIDEFFASLLTFSRRVLPANVALDLEAEPRLSVRIDSAQLEAALLNLIVNAKDAMPNGGIITVAARRLSSGDTDSLGEIMISVSDNGAGMPADVLRHATEAFVTTKPEGKGTGLGLSMVRTFAEQSGGRFELESNEGKGTTARLRLRG